MSNRHPHSPRLTKLSHTTNSEIGRQPIGEGGSHSSIDMGGSFSVLSKKTNTLTNSSPSDMPTSKDNAMIDICVDEDTMCLLTWLAETTELAEAAIIGRLVSAHLAELWELRAFLETHSAGTKEHEMGKICFFLLGLNPLFLAFAALIQIS